ncbi:MAG TPA: LysR family transcriptional regulator [Steroidobacteraceae bacterium]|nr:LysR family transcriptional regulator [Steroidobacteraceae bacterium]
MQFHRFDLNLLIALDTLLREKNITRAAEKVFVSQPAMSAALHRLRDYFDDPLLVRVGRDMELSPRGQSLVDPVREALLLIQATLGTQPTFTAATTQREFTLILSEEAVPGLLPAILERVSTDAPGIRIKIELVSQAALSRVEYGEVDLCLCLDSLRLFDVRAYPDALRSVRLRPVRWVCAVDRDHPSVKDSISTEQYFSLPHVFGRPNGYTTTAEELVRRLLDIEIPVHITVPSLLHLPLVLRGTRLIATMPERVAQMFASTLPIKSFPLPFETPALNEILLWHKRNESDPAHAWLRELLVRLTQQL